MLRRYTPNLLITAGFPCQDASIAGATSRGRKGLAGERTGLFRQLAVVIARIRPEWFILENVPGFLSVNKGSDMAFVVAILSKIGYGVAWDCLDAQYFGVAQRRERLWIVGSFGDCRSAKIFPIEQSDSGDASQVDRVRKVGLCLSTRDGCRHDPSNKNLIASVIVASDYRRTPIGQFGNEGNLIASTITASDERRRGISGFGIDGNIIGYTITSSLRGTPAHITQENLVASFDADREREADGIP